MTLGDCTIGARSLIGIGSVVADGTVIEDDVFLAAGAETTPGQVLEARIPVGQAAGREDGAARCGKTRADRDDGRALLRLCARLRRSAAELNQHDGK